MNQNINSIKLEDVFSKMIENLNLSYKDRIFNGRSKIYFNSDKKELEYDKTVVCFSSQKRLFTIINDFIKFFKLDFNEIEFHINDEKWLKDNIRFRWTYYYQKYVKLTLKENIINSKKINYNNLIDKNIIEFKLDNIKKESIIEWIKTLPNPPLPHSIYLALQGKLAVSNFLPKESGIYFLWRNKEIVYVGKSLNLKARIHSGHHKLKINDLVSIIKCPVEYLDISERYYITLINPKENVS